jgi:hypothetical protein
MIDPEKYRKAKYLKATDLTRPRTRVQIHSVAEEEVGTPSEVKQVMQFTTTTLKPMVLNYTNLVTLVDGFGKDESTWPGKVILLVKTKANFQGKIVDAVRIEIPPQPATTTAPPVPPPPPSPPPAPATIEADPDEADLV